MLKTEEIVFPMCVRACVSMCVYVSVCVRVCVFMTTIKERGNEF